MEKPRIHIDMDHCAVNFLKGTREWLEKFPDEKIPHSHLEFWVDLEPMDGFLDAVKELEKHFNVRILTAPSLRNTACWTGKAMWVKRFLGEEWLAKLDISYDKGQFSGAFLIDDGLQNGQASYNGEHIHFGSDDRFKNWADVLTYILSKKDSDKSGRVFSRGRLILEEMRAQGKVTSVGNPFNTPEYLEGARKARESVKRKFRPYSRMWFFKNRPSHDTDKRKKSKIETFFSKLKFW